MLPRNLLECVTFRRELWNVWIPKATTGTFLLHSILLLSACDGDQPAPPRDNTIWFISLPTRLATDTQTEIKFSWKSIVNGQPDRVYLDFYRDGVVWKLLTTKDVDFRTDGTASFVWDGRIPAATQTAGRRTPVPPRDYTLYMHAGALSNSQLVTIVANEWDTDSDGLSNGVEDENNGVGGHMQTPIVDDGGTVQYGWFLSAQNIFPPAISVNLINTNLLYPNRGSHDYSIARGTIANGTLHNSLRVAHSSSGYQNPLSCDPLDSDNWGVLEIVTLIEKVGRKWHDTWPNYPIMTVGDISRAGGGPFYGAPSCPGHAQHQKGLEVDIRYVRNDNSSDPVNIVTDPGDYDPIRTQRLVDMFIDFGLLDRILSADRNLIGTSYDPSGVHDDHMHIWLQDPDGTGN